MSDINNLYQSFRRVFSGNYPYIFNFCEKRKALIKFFLAGCLTGLFHLLALFIFHDLFFWPIIFSTSFAFILAFAVSFSLQKLWTFRNYSHKKLPRQLILYFGGAFINLNLNALAMYWLVNNMELWYMLAQLIVSLFLGLLNFLNYKFIVFKVYKNEN